MIRRWLRNRRRRKLLVSPFPGTWRAYLNERVPHFASLSQDDKKQLERLVQVFVVEKEWEACQGMELNDEIRVTIAGQACLLLLGLSHDYFYNVRNILVFPSSYVISHEEVDDSGVVHGGDRSLLGHASYSGPVALSWVSSREGGKNHHDGRNVVLHEFAHKLDFMDGFANGVPRLRRRSRYRRWFKVMSREYSELQRHSEQGRATLIDCYGATNPGEFFAVCVECFFEKPMAMQQRHGLIYEILRDYFGQDPAARLVAARNL